ncbi:hypothetical protein ZHAS_00008866 [Anopheles sinensis]|uniref:Uncharacterized protein n=1 Tax=Anopheles sinensis TaxID=74873 RepID=A0A084VTI0_ANOSI|nr:hypothetical protein ZHAS_00008866 [Anopheles sinensis]
MGHKCEIRLQLRSPCPAAKCDPNELREESTGMLEVPSAGGREVELAVVGKIIIKPHQISRTSVKRFSTPDHQPASQRHREPLLTGTIFSLGKGEKGPASEENGNDHRQSVSVGKGWDGRKGGVLSVPVNHSCKHSQEEAYSEHIRSVIMAHGQHSVQMAEREFSLPTQASAQLQGRKTPL